MRAQKESHPKETGRHCTEIELGCVSILGSLLGTFSSEKVQYPPVAKNRLHITPKQREVNEGKRYSTLRFNEYRT